MTHVHFSPSGNAPMCWPGKSEWPITKRVSEVTCMRCMRHPRSRPYVRTAARRWHIDGNYDCWHVVEGSPMVVNRNDFSFISESRCRACWYGLHGCLP